MIQYNTHIRVRYADTDQMGFVYYGKYPEYFEVGRTELIRTLGLAYKEIEDRGIWMPVTELQIHYKFPAYYDELLLCKTYIPEIPRATLHTSYEIFKEDGRLSVSGKVILAFLKQESGRPTRVPSFMLDAIEKKWKE
ncbi:MAG: thioesterase family protein [Bacteroidota bacterium]